MQNYRYFKGYQFICFTSAWKHTSCSCLSQEGNRSNKILLGRILEWKISKLRGRIPFIVKS